jgi:hypothetical protein
MEQRAGRRELAGRDAAYIAAEQAGTELQMWTTVCL